LLKDIAMDAGEWLHADAAVLVVVELFVQELGKNMRVPQFPSAIAEPAVTNH
jgi:hypothetical protein